MLTCRLWSFSLLLFFTISACSCALEIGDAAPDEFVAFKPTDRAQLKLSNFYGKANVVLNTFLQADSRLETRFFLQLQLEAGTFKIKYDAVIITVVSESLKQVTAFKNEIEASWGYVADEVYSNPDASVPVAYGASKIRHQGKTGYRPIVFIIDKSGRIRWKFYGKTNIDRPTIEQVKSELAKLKRSTPLEVESLAPDFSLTEADGKTTFTLSDYKRKKNVLVTILLQTDSPACTRFTSQLAADRKLFDEKYETVVIAIKPEPLEIVSAFKDPKTMDIPILADPGWSVHEAYGITKPYRFHKQDMYRPVTMLIDKAGALRWLYISKKHSDRPKQKLIIKQLEKLIAE